MTITNNFDEFLQGCINNNAVDYKSVYEKLTEKNEQLTEKIYGDKFWGINKGLLQEKSDLIKQYNRVVKEKCKIKKENEELKKQLKNMSESNDAGLLCDTNGDCIYNLKEENEELIKENEELIKFKQEAEDTCSNYAVIEELNQEYQQLQMNLDDEEYKKELSIKKSEKLFDLSKHLMLIIIEQHCDFNDPDDPIKMMPSTTTELNWSPIVEELEKVIDDMNKNDWNTDGNMTQMKLGDHEINIIEEESSDEE